MNSLKKKIKLFILRNTFLLLFFFYSVYHFTHGEYSVLSYIEIQRNIIEKNKELESLIKKRITTESNIKKLMNIDKDNDYLDYMIRVENGLIGENEIVIFVEN